MKSLIHSSIGVLAAFVFCFGLAVSVSAQTISVTFESDPLFAASTSNPIMPGDVIARSFTVQNNSADTEAVYIRTLNDTHTNNFADVLLVSISDAGGVVYDGQLSELFSFNNKSDSPNIGDLASGESRTYDFSVTFTPEAGNTYQGGTASFDFCVGFDGGNENCITGTGGDPDDENTGGGGGGGGSDNPDDDDDLPPGIVAGVGTSTPHGLAQDFFAPIADFVRGAVLGARTEAQENQPEEREETGTESDREGVSAVTERSASPTAVLIDETYCTMWWLLLLGLMLLLWSAYEDWYRGGSAAHQTLFFRNIGFVGAYSALLLVAQFLGILGMFWWVFALVWVIAVAVDYRAHQQLSSWGLMGARNIFFGAASAALILSSFFVGFPCEWWPFMLVAVASGVLYFFDDGA